MSVTPLRLGAQPLNFQSNMFGEKRFDGRESGVALMLLIVRSTRLVARTRRPLLPSMLVRSIYSRRAVTVSSRS